MKQPKLSILICSVTNRVDNFLSYMMKQIMSQLPQNNEVEVLCIVDNRIMSIGEKRNRLIDMARGEYVVFVDDDDRINYDYIEKLLEWIKSWCDVICFNANITVNGWLPKLVKYSKELEHWGDANAYYRKPNHLMCWKSSIAKTVKYEDISFGEDTLWGESMAKYITTEYLIDKVLYYYFYNEKTSESIKRKDEAINSDTNTISG